MDDLDLETVTGWLALARMVTVLSEKLRTDLTGIQQNWMSISDRQVRNQGLWEMEVILAEQLAEIRATLDTPT
jgi:hypothetical protein